jgi:DNA-binding response OmpR family regulator
MIAGAVTVTATRPKILLVEDDENLGRQIVAALEGAQLEATWIKNGSNALAESPDDYHLLILDLMLPGAYGLDILKTFRLESDVPVLILSARNETEDKVRALQLGADDYVSKPFWPEELLARVQARMRRPVLQRSDVIKAGDLSIDINARRVLVEDVPVELTRVEFDLLAALAKRPGAAVPRAWLAEHVLDPEREGTERTLDVHVSRLRKKLGACGKCVATVWGVGYRLESQSAS